jgi:hypothetical protein
MVEAARIEDLRKRIAILRKKITAGMSTSDIIHDFVHSRANRRPSVFAWHWARRIADEAVPLYRRAPQRYDAACGYLAPEPAHHGEHVIASWRHVHGDAEGDQQRQRSREVGAFVGFWLI